MALPGVSEPGPFELTSSVLGGLPVVNYFWHRLRLGELLAAHLPVDDARLKVAPHCRFTITEVGRDQRRAGRIDPLGKRSAKYRRPIVRSETVQFKDGTTNIGNPVLVTNGTAAGATSTLAVGFHQLTAVFIPTNPAAFGASTPQVVTFVVTAPTGR